MIGNHWTSTSSAGPDLRCRQGRQWGLGPVQSSGLQHPGTIGESRSASWRGSKHPEIPSWHPGHWGSSQIRGRLESALARSLQVHCRPLHVSTAHQSLSTRAKALLDKTLPGAGIFPLPLHAIPPEARLNMLVLAPAEGSHWCLGQKNQEPPKTPGRDPGITIQAGEWQRCRQEAHALPCTTGHNQQ